MHASTVKIDISLASKFQKHLSETTWGHGLLDHSEDRNVPLNRIGMSVSIIYRTANIFQTHQLKFHVLQISSHHYQFAVRMQNLVE